MPIQTQVVQQAYKFALAPTPAQERAFASHAGGARFAYNWGLATVAAALDQYAAEKAAGIAKPATKIPGHFDLCKAWTAHKDAHRDVPDDRGRTLGWVGENFVGTYQAALRDAAGAWAKFFDSRAGRRAGRPVGRPRFKGKAGSRASFQMHGDSLRLVDGSHINLPKIGVVKIPGKIRIGAGTSSMSGFSSASTSAAPGPARRQRGPRSSSARATSSTASTSAGSPRRRGYGLPDPHDRKRLLVDGRRVTMPAASAKGRPVPPQPASTLTGSSVPPRPRGGWVDRNARRARRLMRLLRKSATAGLVGCPTCSGSGQVTVTLKDGNAAERKCKACRGNGKMEQARIVRATISRGASGTWWCSVTAELVRDLPAGPSRRQKTAGAVGVDLGVKHLAVTSTGVTYLNSRHLDGALAELKTAQRALSRTQRDSKRRDKARRRVGTLHEQVALMRKDATDRITTELARGHDLIVVEGWNAQRLAQHGSADVPKRLRRDRNRALADAAPGMIRWQLEYKTSWSGSRLVKTAPGDETGRTCSRCGQAKAKPVPLGEDTFRCGSCGYRADRRANTARLLAKRGREDSGTAVPAEPRGGDVRPDTPRRGGRSPVKRDARAQPKGHRPEGRDKTGTPDP
jgi:transposase